MLDENGHLQKSEELKENGTSCMMWAVFYDDFDWIKEGDQFGGCSPEFGVNHVYSCLSLFVLLNFLFLSILFLYKCYCCKWIEVGIWHFCYWLLSEIWCVFYCTKWFLFCVLHYLYVMIRYCNPWNNRTQKGS